MSNVGYATLSVIPSARDFSKNLDSQVAPQLAKSSRSLGARMASGIGTTLKRGLGVVAAGIGAVLGTSLFKGFNRLKNIENATAKLTGLGHSGKTVDKIMKNALASVKGTAFGLDEAATTAAGAVASGIKPGRSLERTLKLVADAATIGGTSMGEMGAIFNKVAASGKIQGDVIAQLGDKGIPILQLLAKQIHKTPQETAKLASKGKIDFATFQNAMSSMSGSALKSGNTTTGAIKNLGASLSRVGAGLLRGIFPQLAPSISGVTKALGPLEDQAGTLGDKIGKLLAPAFEKLPALTTKIVAGIPKVTQAISDLYAGLTLKDPQSVGAPLEGFVAVGARIRGVYEKVAPVVKSVFDSLKPKGGGSALSGVGDTLTRMAEAVQSADLGGSLKKIGDALKGIDWSQFGDALGKSATDSLSIFAVLVSTVADHIDLLAKAMPALIVAFGAFKVAQAAEQVLAVASLPTRALQSASNFALAGAMRANTAAMKANTVGQVEQNTVEKIGILSKVRAAVVTAAKAVAEKVAAGATKAWAAAQWLMNAALSANPIGLVIVAVAALVAGIIIAYKKSETFRKIVAGAFDAISAAARFMWNNVVAPVIRFLLDAFTKVTSFYAALLRGLSKIPGFGWAKGAADKLQNVANKAAGIKDAIHDIPNRKNVDINLRVNGAGKVTLANGIKVDVGQYRARAMGGPVRAGEPYIVGEKRPEVFVPESNGRILPRVPADGIPKKGARSRGDAVELSEASLQRLAAILAGLRLRADVSLGDLDLAFGRG